jgi:hypothetical protein
VLFAVLATANAAGYRYGVSDQAFYIPVIARALDAGAFPRDGSLIDAQGRLMAADEVAAALVRTTGVPLDLVFLTGYFVSLALIWAAIVLIGRHVYRCRWLTIALGAAFTLRHRIPRTSANSFEPYFHPRMLAFGFGALAVAAVLTRRRWTAVVLVGAAAIVHVTTALWFAVLIGTALVVLDPVMRRLGAAAGAVVAAIAAWALVAGPLRSSLTTMDAVWLQAVASKDSLFATEWPLWAWVANLGLAGALWVAHAVRTRRQQATPEDRALVWGATALVGLFLATLPLVAMRVAFPVQLQISRVFWLIDFLALVYLLALVDRAPRAAAAGRTSAHPRARRGVPSPMGLAAVLLVAASAARGTYVMLVERPERTLFAVRLPDSPWEGAMRWLAAQPPGIHVLADPGHAWKHGTSVRVSAQRDVLLEEVKDSAIAIYSRDVAVRVLERTAAVGDFGALSAERARDLARRYDLDYLVTDADLPLPQAYRNAQFRIYHLK